MGVHENIFVTGLYQINTEIWIESPASPTVGFWDSNQPDKESGNCIYLVRTNSAGEFYWRYDDCRRRKRFVCVRPACLSSE